MVTQPGQWEWTGHGEYLRTNHRGLIDPSPVMDELETPKCYEAFIREEAKNRTERKKKLQVVSYEK